MAVLSATEVPLYRLSAQEYQRIVATGALEGARVELLDGIMSEMSPQSPRHAALVESIAEYLGSAGRVRTHSPFEIEDADSVPEPDVLLTDEAKAADHHPRTARVVVEVAVSSQDVDRGPKARLYAGAGVPVYWLIDVPAERVEVRTDPVGARYTHTSVRHVGDTLEAPAAGLPELSVSALLGDHQH
ncbi:MAG: Uma2 family endonuclease [Solirubrobacterales bacterium]|nr:Uma2 family endonuclease [Solirubrobacterales bacterium]